MPEAVSLEVTRSIEGPYLAVTTAEDFDWKHFDTRWCLVLSQV
jgi:hypothetical protein